jgi:hypothetical protein
MKQQWNLGPAFRGALCSKSREDKLELEMNSTQEWLLQKYREIWQEKHIYLKRSCRPRQRNQVEFQKVRGMDSRGVDGC